MQQNKNPSSDNKRKSERDKIRSIIESEEEYAKERNKLQKAEHKLNKQNEELQKAKEKLSEKKNLIEQAKKQAEEHEKKKLEEERTKKENDFKKNKETLRDAKKEAAANKQLIEKLQQLKEQEQCVSESETAESETEIQEEPIITLKTVNDYLSDHKLILGLLVTILTIIVSACMYLFQQGYLAYFNVGNEWNNYADKSALFLLVKPLCITVILILVLFLFLLPILCIKKLHWRILYCLLLIGSNYGLVLFYIAGESVGLLAALLFKLILPITALTFYDLLSSENERTVSRNNYIQSAFVYVLLIVTSLILGHFIKQHITIAEQFMRLILLLLIMVGVNEALFLRIIYVGYSKISNTKNNSTVSDVKEMFVMVCIMIAIAGCMIPYLGESFARLEKTFSIIYTTYSEDVAVTEAPVPSNELSGLALPSADAVHQINEILTTTATTGTTLLQLSATTVTMTTVQTAAADTSQEEPPEPVIVYVVLAENKDCYLTSIGKIDAGGILHIDRSVEYTLEKKNQTTLKKKFQDVKLDYTYPKEVTP